ncbi:MAG: hypothetical protein Q9213_001155 [Squamulea squamosa]
MHIFTDKVKHSSHALPLSYSVLDLASPLSFNKKRHPPHQHSSTDMIATISNLEGSAALLDHETQNEPPAMQLRDRRERKAPRRYAEELAQEEDGESRNLITRLPKHRAYRGPVIEYNPNLSPAIFPTLDLRENNAKHQSSNAQHVHSIQHKTSHNPSAASSHLSSQQQSPSEAALDSRDDRGHLDGLELNLIQENYPTNPYNLAMDSSGNRPHYDTNNESYIPVWWNSVQNSDEAENMNELSEKRATEDREQMFIDAIVTSDEEEQPRVHEKDPSWDNIPLALQMEMINQAAGDGPSVTQAALTRLRLTEAQQHSAIAEYRLQLGRQNEEDANIEKHQQLINEILLNGPRPYSTPQGFRSLAYVDLYKHPDHPDDVVTALDVANARAYMTFCRLNTKFLHSWAKPAKAPVGRPGSPVCLEDEDEHDAQYPHSVSLREAILNNVINPSTPPNLSMLNCTHPRPSNGTAPEINLTPVAQRHRTPKTLSPIPLRLEMPILVQPVVELPTFNPLTSHQSTGSTNGVDLDELGSLHGLVSGSHPADRNLQNGEPIHRGFSPPMFRNAGQGPAMVSPSTSSTSSVLVKRDETFPHHERSESDSAPQPKRKRTNTAGKTLPSRPSNTTSPNVRIVINGRDGEVEGKPLPYQSPTQQFALVPPMGAMDGAVQRMTPALSAAQVDGLHANNVVRDVEVCVTTGRENEMTNGTINGTSNGQGSELLDKRSVDANGVVDSAGRNGNVENAKVKKKVGRPRKIKI